MRQKPGFPAQAEQIRRAPEHASGWTPKQLVRHRHCMVATANRAATQAGLDVLAQGGNAVDAAIAVQAMLGLTEPQSSGLAGGGYALVYDAGLRRVFAYDGRETAPLREAAPWTGPACTLEELGMSPASFGVPGMPALLECLHQSHGRRPWPTLFGAARGAAEQGFEVSRRMAVQIEAEAGNLAQPDARRYLLDEALPAHVKGTPLRNPAYVRLLDDMATLGAAAFYEGTAAKEMLDAVLSHHRPGPPSTMTLSDFTRYQVKPHAPLEGTYRGNRLHGVAGSSAGGLMTLQMLGLLETFDIGSLAPSSVAAAHLQTQVSRLAFADRFKHYGDPAFSQFEHSLFLEADYLHARSRQILRHRDMGQAQAGWPAGMRAAQHGGGDDSGDFPSTTHFSIVDAQGNAVAMTSSIGMAFGCRLMACGTFLNDQLVAFAQGSRADPSGRLANGLESGKRPLSSMAPTFVFGPDGALRMVTGSPGAAAIVGYTVQSILGVIDWRLDVQRSIDMPHVINRNGATELEKDTPAEHLKDALAAIGHAIEVNHQTSGVHAVAKDGLDWTAGCDPRRDGVAMGA